MKLDIWVDQMQAKEKPPRARKDILRDLAQVSGVAFQTLSQCERGARLSLYDKALAIQTATMGQVTVLDLCDPDPYSTFEIIRESFNTGPRYPNE